MYRGENVSGSTSWSFTRERARSVFSQGPVYPTPATAGLAWPLARPAQAAGPAHASTPEWLRAEWPARQKKHRFTGRALVARDTACSWNDRQTELFA